jgi:hypothetical protein
MSDVSESIQNPIIRWHCGYYVGPPKWHMGLADWEYEPDECNTDFTTEFDEELWLAKLTSATCPKCDNDLSQKYDEPELIEGPIVDKDQDEYNLELNLI